MRLQEIREQVLTLPDSDRWELIEILMRSLRSKPSSSIKRRGIAASLVGIAKTDALPPTDEEVKLILETRLLQK